jgi:hypothetical protein
VLHLESFSAKHFLWLIDTMRKFKFFILVVCALLYCNVGDSQEVDPNAAEKCSVFESILINGEAWQKGDFLFRERTTFDSINKRSGFKNDGVLVESETFCRVVFDFVQKKLCVLSWRVETILDLSVEGGEKSITQMRGYSFSPIQVVVRDFPGEISVTKHSPKANLNEEYSKALADNYPDFRAVGYTRHGGAGGLIEAAKKIPQIVSGKNFHRAVDVSRDQYKIQFRLPGGNDEIRYILDSYHFDNSTNMPAAFNQTLFLKEPENDSPTYEFDDVEYKWKEFDGVQVPTFIRQHRSELMHVGMGRHVGMRTCVTDFHWFSFNGKDEYPSDFFDGTCMKDMDSMLNRIDPEKANAKFPEAE